MSAVDIASALITFSKSRSTFDTLTEEDLEKITNVTQLLGPDDVFEFYGSGGVTALCRITELIGRGEAKSEVNLSLLFAWQAIMTIGQVRTYCLLRGVIPTVAKICRDTLRMIDLKSPDGATDEEALLHVHLQAANCLNILPTSHEVWTEDDVPQLCMMLITQNRDYKNITESFNGGAVSRMDAGMMLVANFCSSKAFFDYILDIGIVDELFLIARELTDLPQNAEDQSLDMIMVRYCILMVLFLGIPRSCEMIDDLDSKTEAEYSVIRAFLPNLANYSENVMVRSLAHQALAIYSKVVTPQHEWITESIPPDNINELEPAYSFKRPCHRAGCSNSESAPLKFSYCSACKVPAYCSAICQKGDWKTHKKICKYMALDATAAEPVKNDDQLD
eukprot:TRINITY_DN4557_c0_g1_i1.p1 TRINITY_DN4557_c0_g1~~TRINITY_DN4557_c0_g1_i1.p1  ORF type:complete len:409 (+),score=49.96 TRINITY_DN4557_c0_g1_i1:57-1229(+)